MLRSTNPSGASKTARRNGLVLAETTTTNTPSARCQSVQRRGFSRGLKFSRQRKTKTKQAANQRRRETYHSGFKMRARCSNAHRTCQSLSKTNNLPPRGRSVQQPCFQERTSTFRLSRIPVVLKDVRVGTGPLCFLFS